MDLSFRGQRYSLGWRLQPHWCLHILVSLLSRGVGVVRAAGGGNSSIVFLLPKSVCSLCRIAASQRRVKILITVHTTARLDTRNPWVGLICLNGADLRRSGFPRWGNVVENYTEATIWPTRTLHWRYEGLWSTIENFYRTLFTSSCLNSKSLFKCFFSSAS